MPIRNLSRIGLLVPVALGLPFVQGTSLSTASDKSAPTDTIKDLEEAPDRKAADPKKKPWWNFR